MKLSQLKRKLAADNARVARAKAEEARVEAEQLAHFARQAAHVAALSARRAERAARIAEFEERRRQVVEAMLQKELARREEEYFFRLWVEGANGEPEVFDSPLDLLVSICPLPPLSKTWPKSVNDRLLRCKYLRWSISRTGSFCNPSDSIVVWSVAFSTHLAELTRADKVLDSHR